jgi:hypothetical protein
MAQAESQVALLATVALLLDDEAEAVAAQVLRLCLTLDPLARARLRLLRVRGQAGRLMAEAVTEDSAALAPNTSGIGAASHPGDPNATQAAGAAVARLRHGPAQPFEQALQQTLQEVLRTSGSDPLPARGFALVPNDVALHLVGRIDTPLLAPVAQAARNISGALGAQLGSRRFGLLLAAAPPGEQDLAVTAARPGQMVPAWQETARRQPWNDLLAWHSHGGEPPLLYTFIFEAWDEAGRYLDRPQLHYTVAEALFALFATGMLDHPAFKEALDLSTAAVDSARLNRIGSIGASLITSPTQGMLDYLAHRLAADLLLRRGLLGEEGGVAAPVVIPALNEQTQRETQQWLTTIWQARVYPGKYALPRGLPPRIAGEKLTSWAPLAISRAAPNPAGLTARWEERDFPLNDEQYWDLVAQHEYDTARDLQEWDKDAAAAFAALGNQLWDDIRATTLQRVTQTEGIERALAYARALRDLLIAEQHRLQQDQRELEAQLDQHHRQYDAIVRRAHRDDGIPAFPDPPARPGVERLPGNLEALTHDTTAAAFTRTPLPATLGLVALLVAVFGAAFADVAGRVTALPAPLRATLTGPNGHLAGAGIMLALFAVTALAPLTQTRALRRWQRHLAEERALLNLAHAKTVEHALTLQLIDGLVARLNIERDNLLDLTQQVRQAAEGLAVTAAKLAAEYTASASLARDIFVAQGQLWEGRDPAELYAQVRERQDEPVILPRFLQYVQAHAGGVAPALRQGRLEALALEFMYAQLRQELNDLPFAAWSNAAAADALARAVQAARVPLQTHAAGRPMGQFALLAAHPEVAWLPRLADQQHLATVPGPSPRWCLVARAQTRASYPLVQ